MGINANIGSGLIGAGSQLLGGIAGGIAQNSANKTNLQISRENNAANQQLQASQNQWNVDQWNRENTYNSASAQKQRLLDAGLNPSMALSNIATGSAQSSQLTSAPYTPNQQVQVQPVNYASGISNAGNDFVTSYLNMRMMKANVEKSEAEAKNALANADATTGYKSFLAKSEVNRNDTLNRLNQLQSQNQEIENQIKTRYGDQIAQSTLEQIQAVRNRELSQRDLNMDMLDKLASEVKLNVARANNIDLESNKLKSLTPYIIQQLKLTNTAEQYKNTVLKVNADWEFQNGS